LAQSLESAKDFSRKNIARAAVIWLYLGVFNPADGGFPVLSQFDGSDRLPPKRE